MPSERELRLGLGTEAEMLEEPTALLDQEVTSSFFRDLGAMLWPPGYAGRRAGLYLIILAVAGVATGADFQIFFALAALIQSAFGGLHFLAIAYSVNQLLLLSPLLIGFLADRWSRVWLVRVGGLLSALGLVLIGLATTPLALLGGKTVSTTGSFYLVNGAEGPLVADYVRPEERGKAFGFLLMGSSAAGVIVPVGLGAVGLIYGWRTAFIAVGLASVPFVLLYCVLREPARGALEGAVEPQPPFSFTESFRRAARVGTLRRLWLAQVLVSAASFANLIAVVYFAIVFHLNVFQYSLLLSGQSLALFVAQFFVGPLTDRLLRRPASVMTFLAFLAVILAGNLAVLTFAPNLAVAVVASILGSVAFFLLSPAYSPVLAALLSVTIPPRIRGFGMQSILPWSIATPVFVMAVLGLMGPAISLREQFLFFIPFYLAGAAVYLWAGGDVARDIRTALSAAAAAEETRGGAKLLAVRGLEVAIEGAQILFGADFDVAPGEIVALLGTNGAGKSTLLRAIAGINMPQGGAVFFEDEDITYLPAHMRSRRGLAMVAGGRAVFPSLTVRENLALGGGEVEPLLGLFPALRPRLGTRAGDLSGGEQQMLCLAQALTGRPRLLLVDELTLGLAPQVVEELLRSLRRIRDSGTTVVLVEQSVNLALTIADRAVFMEKGTVRFDGPAAELLGRGDLVRSVFLGAAQSTARLGTASAPLLEEAPETVLEAAGLTVRYGGVTAVEDVSLSVRSGEVVGFIGPNGAGKSTLFDALSGFCAPAAGSVALLGADITALPADARARLGLLRSFQNVRLFPSLSVRETIAIGFERHLGADVASMGGRRLARRIDNLVESLGLGPHQDKFVGELSTGTRRIVDLACMLAAEPKVLLLDEPSSGLAQAETEELGPVIGRIGKETGCSVLVIEHDLELVRSLSQRLYALDQGRVIASGLPAAVLADPAVVASYLPTQQPAAGGTS